MQQTVKNKSAGSALVVVVALLALIAALASLGAGDFATTNNADRERETLREMEVISSFISAYAQRYDRVPCPADPAVASGNATVGTGFGYESCGRADGILPFRTLQIPTSFAKDEWGNYYTYSSSAAFSMPDLTDTYAACLTADWFSNVAGTNYHLNPSKAAFCCPGTRYDSFMQEVRIFNNFNNLGIQIEPPVNRNYPPGTVGSTADGSPLVTNPGGSAYGVAYALISHGRNRMGAFQVDAGGAHGPVCCKDFENTDAGAADRGFSLQHQVLAEGSPHYFDDLVIYKNQYQVYAQLGGGTCSRPWR